MGFRMDIANMYRNIPPTVPPNMAVFLLSKIGSNEENTTIISRPLAPKYNNADVIKLPLLVKSTPWITK